MWPGRIQERLQRLAQRHTAAGEPQPCKCSIDHLTAPPPIPTPPCRRGLSPFFRMQPGNAPPVFQVAGGFFWETEGDSPKCACLRAGAPEPLCRFRGARPPEAPPLLSVPVTRPTVPVSGNELHACSAPARISAPAGWLAVPASR